MMTLERPKEQMVTHTHTSDDGVVVVITDVPALVYQDEQGTRQVRYKGLSSRVVTNYIKEALEVFSEPSVYPVSFEAAKFGISVDAQIRFVGDKVRYNHSTIKTWRKATNAIFRSYDEIRSAIKGIRGLADLPYPVVQSVSPGSLIFGLKAEPEPPQRNFQDGLFADNTIDDSLPEEVQILQILIDGYNFVSTSHTENDLILNYPQVRLAAVEAVRILAPSENSEIEEVQIIPRSKLMARGETVTLTPTTHSKAKRKQIELAKDPSEDDRRDVVIVGQIDTLNRQGRMTIRDVELNLPEGKNYATSAIFHDSIFKDLTEFFKNKQRVLFRGIEYKYHDKWTSQPIIKFAEEAPSEAEVARMGED